jgi:hypothetical protein
MTGASAAGQPRQTPEGDTSRQGEVAPSPRPPSRRSPALRTDLLDATLRLGPRDFVLAQLLDEHHTLTTAQITAVLFTSRATAASRLYALRRIGWIGRFTAIRASGRLDTHWVLDHLGTQWAAPRDGRRPPTPKAVRERQAQIAASSHLEHTDGANQFFIDLLTAARHHTGSRLARWWSPARTAAALGQRVHPDGHGVWEEPDPATETLVQVGFLFEYDTGTETLDRLTAKTEPYRRLRQDGGPAYPVLLWLPSPAREANFHRKLNGHAAQLGITLATTTPAAVTTCAEGITGPIWKIAGNGRARHRLGELPSRHGKDGAPYHPGQPTPQQDPLHLLRSAG